MYIKKKVPWSMVIWSSLLVILMGCGAGVTTLSNTVSGSNDTSEQAAATDISENAVTEPFVVDLDAIPPVDITKHNVPLGEIYFDTFRRVNRVIPLSDISLDMIRDLRDAIPPIYNPKFETADQGEKWLSQTDIVVGYTAGEEAYAYPVRILNWHEIVAHDVNGEPILATY
ncbi:MAG: DUF3179 domain-containing (seleno)protein [Chloroflexota bacterium]